MILKLRRGTAPLQVKMGRWRGVKRKERTCKECNSGEVEDVIHWLLRCPTWNSQRQPLMKMIQLSQDDACVCVCMYVLACMHVCVCVHVCACMHACMCVCVYACVCA